MGLYIKDRIYNKHDILLLFLFSIFFNLFFIFIFKDRLYFDALKAIAFGREYLIDKENFYICSKTFIGPVLWFLVSERFGIWGLKLINVLSFSGLFAIQYSIGRKIYRHRIVILALFLFAFYLGTNLNIIAGEQDDNITALLFTLGVFLYLKTGKPFFSSLLMGLAFLFKFSSGIFYIGFASYLLVKRYRKEFLLSMIGMSAPFLFINFLDNFNSISILWKTVVQLESVVMLTGAAAWKTLFLKLLTTGMVPFFLVSLWWYRKKKNDFNFLFLLIPSAYFVSVVVSRYINSSIFIMMQAMLFLSFLMAEFLLSSEYFRKGSLGRFFIIFGLSLYLLYGISATYYNIKHYTYDATKGHILECHLSEKDVEYFPPSGLEGRTR